MNPPEETLLIRESAADAVSLLVSELDASTVAELLDAFFQDIPGQVAILRERASKGEWSSLGRTAHSVAGSASTFGLEGIRALALGIEQAAAGQDSAATASGIESLEQAFHAVMPLLRSLRQGLAD